MTPRDYFAIGIAVLIFLAFCVMVAGFFLYWMDVRAEDEEDDV